MTYDNLKRLAQTKDLILGSASPRRVELLKEIGVNFRQVPSGFEEHNDDKGQPYEMAVQLAREKAISLKGKLSSNEIVITADTVVELQGNSLGKPVNANDAFGMLGKLSGKKHTVCTALAFGNSNGILVSGYELTEVYFNEVTGDQIDGYIKTKEPMDKAGAYGIQGMGGFLVDRILGNLDNVIGLPRTLLERLAGEVLVKLEKETKETS